MPGLRARRPQRLRGDHRGDGQVSVRPSPVRAIVRSLPLLRIDWPSHSSSSSARTEPRLPGVRSGLDIVEPRGMAGLRAPALLATVLLLIVCSSSSWAGSRALREETSNGGGRRAEGLPG